MIRLRLAVTCSLALFLAAGWLMGQDSKSTSDDTPSTGSKSKGTLPKYFGRLGLTDDQKQKVYKIHTSYKTKIDALTEQLEDLKNQQLTELLKVLSDTQRTHLRELQTREKSTTTTTSKDAPATKKEEKTDKKADEKKADEKK